MNTSTEAQSSKHSNQKLPPLEKCVCSDLRCQQLAQNLQLYAPEGHLWIGTTTFRRKVGGKQDLLFCTIKDHLKPLVDVDIIGKKYFVARHHFPLNLLHDNKLNKRYYISLLTKQDVLRIDGNKKELSNENNKVWNIEKQFGLPSKTFKELYVQAPCNTLQNVQDFVDSLLSVRGVPSVMINPILPPSPSKIGIAYSHSTNLESPKNQPVNPNIQFPTVEDLQQIISYEWSTKKNVFSFDSNRDIQRSILLLRHFHKNFNPIPLWPDKYFIICQQFGDSNHYNEYYTFKKNKRTLGDNYSSLCTSCQNAKRLFGRSQAKHPLHSEERITHDSSVPLSKLKPEEQSSRLKNIIMNKKSTRKSYLYSLTSRSDDIINSIQDSTFGRFLESAKKFIAINKPSIKQHIIKMLLELEFEENKNKNESTSLHQQIKQRAKLEEQSTFIFEQIRNIGKTTAGNKNGVRFCPSTMRLSVSMYLSSRRGKEEVAKLGLYILPSNRTIQAFIKSRRPVHGRDISSFKNFHNTFGSDKVILGQIICDKMEMNEEFAWNNQGKIVGLISNDKDKSLDTKECLRQYNKCTFERPEEDHSHIVLEHVNEKATKKVCEALKGSHDYFTPSKKVNQWRFRSSEKISDSSHTLHNGPFFYNGGKSSGDMFLGELMWCKVCYAIINVVVVGLCSDMGGSNEGLHRILENIGSTSIISDDMGMLPTDIVETPSFITALYCICAWACATHTGKGIRNQSEMSEPLGDDGSVEKEKRCLTRDSILIAWISIIRLFNREQESMDTSKSSGLTAAAVFLDNWNKMNVSLTMQPFSAKCIGAIIEWLCEELHFDLTLHYTPGPYTEDYDRFKEILELITSKAKSNKDTTTETWQDIGFLNYAIIFNGIFHSRFFARDKGITKYNIESETIKLTEMLEFFKNWRVDVVTLRGVDPYWWKKCISSKTYHNLRKMISGFLQYARTILKHNPDAYIPYLHANESTVESLFAYSRGLDKDRHSSYPSAVLGSTYSYSASTLMNSKMYSNEHIDLESDINPYRYGATDYIHKKKKKKDRKYWTHGNWG